MEETVTSGARKAISTVCVEDQEGRSPRRNGTLNTKEVDQGQDNTAELGTTAAPGIGQTAEGTATGVAEAIPVTDKHLETATDPHPETATDHPV